MLKTQKVSEMFSGSIEMQRVLDMSSEKVEDEDIREVMRMEGTNKDKD